MSPQSKAQMLQRYDADMFSGLQRLYYGNSDFYNYGYWTSATQTQRQASEALVEKLLSFIPEKSGTILDVACGLGASTRELLKHYEPGDVFAINLSAAQVARARENAPGASVQVMDAASLDFAGASFDNVLCVESAFHFETRDRFLEEVMRVLKPGGRLVLSDIIFRPPRFGDFARPYVPDANDTRDLKTYRARLEAAGFEVIELQDATEQCLRGFLSSLRRWPAEARQQGALDGWRYHLARILTTAVRFSRSRIVRHYVLASARRPLV